MTAAAAILGLFAELTATRRGPALDVGPDGHPFAWLGTEQSLFALSTGARPSTIVLDHRPGLAELTTLDSLHRHERLLREGWVFLAGSMEQDGERRDLLLPLVSRPVRLTRRTGGIALTAAGDRELIPLVPAGPTRNDLEGFEDGVISAARQPIGFAPERSTMPMIPRDLVAEEIVQLAWLKDWIRAVADAAGIHLDVIVGPSTSPVELRGGPDVTAVIGSGIYVARDLRTIDLSTTLTSWSVVPGIDETALGSVYGIRPTIANGPAQRELRSVLPLTARQREVIVRARSDDVVVVSGPPGSGKSHTVVAAAMDAVDRGLSVLVATQTDHAADVLAAMLRRHPGPDPILFGDAERRDAVASQLGTGLGVPLSATELERRSIGVDRLDERVRWIESSLQSELAVEIGVDTRWDELAHADAELALGVGSLVSDRMHAERCVTPESRAAVAALATSLRAERAWRRVHLEALDGSSLLQALPLWIGTLRDIDDLLPPTPALFGLVILDEAAQIDQPTAALALLRADRVVVVGDPHQLRHEATTDELDVATALDERSLTSLAPRLDPTNSAFDVAAGAAAVTWLDEHFRSAPHLIQFSAEHFYPHPFHLMTRHPRNETDDVIDTVTVEGRRGEDGINEIEVQAVHDLLVAAIEHGDGNIGLLSPIPAQAKALEAMVLERLPRDQVAALDIQVGDVDDFQGSERDLVILSLAIDPLDVDGTRSTGRSLRAAIEDPNRFNVMVTRARDRLVVVTSVDDAVGGLLGEFLVYAEHAPLSVSSNRPRDPWVGAVADELGRLGVTTRPDYPVGQWTIDLCIGDGDKAMAIECAVHPAGPAVHIGRHRALQRAGWRIADCFATGWDGDPVSAAVALTTDLRRDPRR